MPFYGPPHFRKTCIGKITLKLLIVLFSVICPTSQVYAVNVSSFADLASVINGTPASGTETADFTVPNITDFNSFITIDSGKTININGMAGGTTLEGTTNRLFTVSGNASLNLTDIIIQNFSRTSAGGAIRIDSGLSTFDGITSFINNSANGGSAVYLLGTAAVQMNGDVTKFVNNTSLNNGHGGAIALRDSSSITFGDSSTDKLYAIGNTASLSGAAGGFLYNNGSGTITFNAEAYFGIDESSGSPVISGNKSAYRGGAIYSSSATGVLNFENIAYFHSNESIGSGGAIFFSGTSLNFKGSETKFINNKGNTNNSSSEGGGGLTITAGDALFGDQTTDTLLAAGNTSGDRGGFLQNISTGTHTFNAVTTIGGITSDSGNTAVNGGGIHTSAGTMNFENVTTFQNNQASTNGGAAFIQGASTVVNFNGAQTDFISNTSVGNGGAIYSQTNATITFSGNALFKDNEGASSSSIGGAIYVRDTILSFNGDVTEFTGNKSGNSGGAFYSRDGGSITFGDSPSDILTAKGNSTVGNGGFMINTGNKTVTFNAASTFGGANATDGNSAGYGSVLHSTAGTFVFNNDALFQNNYTTGGAGVLYLSNTTVSFNGSRTSFIDNRSGTAANGNGGAIYSTGTGTLTFGDNSTDILVAQGNTAVAANGGFLYNNSDKTITFIAASTFGGSATDEGNLANTGGVIYALKGNILFENDASFQGNEAYLHGGSVYLAGDTTLSFKGNNTEFISNKGNTKGTASAGGGGLTLTGTSNVTFGDQSTDTLLATGNTSGDRGGFIFNISTGTQTFNAIATIGGATSDLGNKALNGGGIFMSSGGTINFENVATFQNNQASSYGGAIYLQGTGSTINFKGSQTTFSDNKAATAGTGIGGAIYASSGTVLNFTGNALFDSNINMAATGNGGAVYADGASVYFRGSKTEFKDNESGLAGAAVYLRGTGDIVFGTLATDTLIATGNNVTNSASLGGFLYNNDNRNIIFNAKTTIGTAASGNSANKGGAIVNSNAAGAASSVFDFNNEVTFENNSAIQQGGAIYTGGGTFNFSGTDTLFKDNAAGTLGGGAIFVSNNAAVLNFKSALTEFIGNSTTGGTNASGGAFLMTSSGTLNFGTSSSDILNATGNSASYNGGFLSMTTGTAVFNATSTFGGSSTSDGNTAGAGGAFYISGGTLTFNTSTVFSNNKANTFGGALYIAGGSVEFNDGATFSGNTHAGGNNDIYMTAGSLTTAGTKNYTFAGGISSSVGSTAQIYHDSTGIFTADMTGYSANYTQNAGSSLINGDTAGTYQIETGNSTFTGSLSGTLINNAANLIEFSGLNKTMSGVLRNNSTGTIKLTGTGTTVSGSIFGAAGTLLVDGTVVNTGSISQKDMTVNGSLVTNAGNLHITETVINTGTLTFTGGTNANTVNNTSNLIFQGTGTNDGAVSGNGSLSVSGTWLNNAMIQQTALNISGEMTTHGDNIDIGTGGINVSGTLNVTKGNMTTTGQMSLSSSNSVLNLYNPTPDTNSETVTANVASLNAVTGSEIKMDIFSDGGNDKINVLGAAQMDGKLTVRAGVGTYNNAEFILINAASIAGDLVNDIQSGTLSLASLTGRGLTDHLNAIYTFDATTDTIKITLTGFSASNMVNLSGLSFNQREAAGALDFLSGSSSGDLADVINSILGGTEDETRSALSQISPYFLANVLRPQLNTAYRNGLYNRIQNYCPGCTNDGLWIDFDHANATYKSDLNSIKDFKTNTTGIKIGYDRYFHDRNAMIGAFVASTPKTMKQNGSEADVDSYGGGIYGGLQRDKWELKGFAGISFNSYDVKRLIYAPVSNLDRIAISSFRGYSVDMDIEAAYKIPLENEMTLKPYFGFGGSMVNYKSFTEKRADSLNQSVKGDTEFASEARIGLRLDGIKDRINWTVGTEYGYTMTGYDEPEITSSFQGTANEFRAKGAKIGRHTLGLSAGVGYKLANGWDVYANAEYRTASDYENTYVGIGFRYAFCDQKRPAYKAPVEQAVIPVSVPFIPRSIATTHYGFDKSDLTNESKKVLKEAVQKIPQDKAVIVIGHTDSTGPESYNQKLSEKRAQNVYHYLINLGVEQPRIAYIGKGENDPVADNKTKEGRASNRRVDVELH